MPSPESGPPGVPRWARLADFLCLALAFAAIVVTMSGGFRGHVGGLRVGVTSPLPLMLWCLVIGLVRHVAVPREPLYRDFPRRLSVWVRTPAVRAAAPVVLGTCPIILFVGYLAVFMFGYAGGRAPLRYFTSELLNLPVRWDAGWYIQIVIDGYTFKPDEPALQQNVVFFPAYPMMMRYLGRLLGGHMTGYVLAGVGLSLTAFFGALVYLYLFALDRCAEEESRYALWLIATYPFALFFGAIYTESLFLLGAIGAFYHFGKREFGRAALWGLLVGLTRLNGALLSIPLAMLAVLPMLGPALARLVAPVESRASQPGADPSRAIAAAAMPGIGLLLYAAFAWHLTGSPIAWLSGHLAWGRSYQSIFTMAAHQYSFIASAGLSGYMAEPGYDVLNTIGALFALGTVWPVARRLGLAYAVFMLINILPALSRGGLLSAGRFSSVLFPAFVCLAGAVRPNHRAVWVVVFAAMQAFNAALFYTWRPLF